MDKHKLLIIEDEEIIRKQLKWALRDEYHILLARNRKEALAIMREEKPFVVTLDMGLPPFPDNAKEGFKCLEDMLRMDPFIKIVIVTGNKDKENALKAVSMGAYDYYLKPIMINELKIILKRAYKINELERENLRLQSAEDEKRGGLQGIIGSCEKMKKVFETIRRVANTDISVLITGESGTGKELVASAIHSLSRRRSGPFVAINCAAIPENLLESELFGHERGSFTGAHSQKKGRVEDANKGTLFLDEIGELHTYLQVKLLRFLQDHKIERVGGNESIEVDTRVVAATNRDIDTMLSEGRFREDLYYRLGTVIIHLPPLRERGDDILNLARDFLSRSSYEVKRRLKGFSLDAIIALQRYSWPGNVRELENKIKRAVIMAKGSMITPEDLNIDLPEEDERSKDNIVNLNIKKAKEQLERELIEKALLKNADNLTKTARELGISRPTLYDLMKRHGINKDLNSLPI